MKKRNSLVLVLGVALLVSCQQNVPKNDIDKRVEDLLAQMTIEEKVGQMNQYTSFYDATGPVPANDYAQTRYEQIKQGLVGSMLNVKGVEEVRKYQQLAVDSSRLGIPMIFAMDVIHGEKTIFPIPLGETASWDLELIEKTARVAAIEASAEGINWTFAPMVDISRDPRWGRVMEGAGEDTYLGSRVGVARVKGFQGDDLSTNNTIIACAKHFAAYGFVEGGRDYNSVIADQTTLHNVIFPPFKAVLEEANVRTFMNSFNIVNGVPATGNAYLMRDVLKRDWAFDGFVVSDWGSGAEMINHGFSKDLKEAAKQAATAGSDMDMESNAYISHLVELVKSGEVPESVVDDAARRILRIKFELGLFDDPYKYCDEVREKEMLYNDVHMELALEAAKRSIVLLKNENKLLPLSKEQTKIAIIGDLADDKTSMLGNWIMAAENGTAVSVIEGVEKYTKNYTYLQGVRLLDEVPAFATPLQVNETDRTGMSEAVALADKSDVVVMVLGEYGLHSGEARSRAELDLPGLQQDLLEEVYAVNKNIVLVIPSGRPLTITWADEHIPAILEVWQLGTRAGDAIAQVLFGDYNPSGKLPMTFPRSVAHIPVFYNHFNTGRPTSGEIFYPHYMEEDHSPLYPFGYGLSYSEFEYANLQAEASEGTIKVSVEVKNTSDVDGEEVVQLYIRDKVASIVRPVKELKGFAKRMIKANQTEKFEFELSKSDLSFYNAQSELVFESGEFEIMVGGNSQTCLSVVVEL
ncbi:MAG: beta-glucosidase BglX [Mangrovibacterium sp.]